MAHATVTHEGRRTADGLEEGGDGGPALCVHGPAAASAVWDHQYSLAVDRPIAALDLSGHGDSDDIDAEPGWETIAAYSSDVTAVANELEANLLVGHSMGAVVAVHAVANRGLSIDGLVIMGAGVRVPVAHDILAMAREDHEELLEFLLQPGRLLFEPDPSTAERCEQALRGCEPSVMERDFRTCQLIDLRGDLPDIETPTLVLAGEHDRMMPPEQGARVADTLPRALFTIIADAAHLPMLEQPTATNEKLRAFFADPTATVAASP